jgi:outer membrane receptor protein involved in Fe transport
LSVFYNKYLSNRPDQNDKIQTFIQGFAGFSKTSAATKLRRQLMFAFRFCRRKRNLLKNLGGTMLIQSFCRYFFTALAALIIFSFGVATATFGQSGGGAAIIGGTVNDSNGAAIQGATVRLLNLASSVENTALTDSAGKYQFTGVASGQYRLTATMQGFGDSSESLAVTGATNVTKDFALSPGAIRDVVTVTAGKGSDRLASETPQTVTVTSSEQIEQRVPRSTFEAIERSPNLTVVETNPARERPRLRGLASTRILIVVDGEKLNNSRFDPGANGPPIAVVDPTELESAEVLSGAGSSLYGSDAVGGTINLITRAPLRPEKGVLFGVRLNGNYVSNGAIRRGNATVNLSNQMFALRGSFNINRNANYKTGNGGFTIADNLVIGNFYLQFPGNTARGYPVFALPAGSEILNGAGHGDGRQFDFWFFPLAKHSFRAKYLGQDDRNLGNAFSGPPYEAQNRYTSFREFNKYGIRYEGLDLTRYVPRVSANFYYQKLSFPQNQYTFVNLAGGSYTGTTTLTFTGNPSNWVSNTPIGVTPAVSGASYVYNLNTVGTYGVDLQGALIPFRGLLATIGGGRTKDNSRDYFYSTPFCGYGSNVTLGCGAGATVIGASAPISNYVDNNLYGLLEFDRIKYVRLSAGVRRDNWVTEGLPGGGFPLSTEFAALNAAVPGLTANPQALTSLVSALPNLTALAGGAGSVGSNRNSITYNFGIVGRLPFGINPYFRYSTSYREPGITERYLIRNFSPGSFFASLVVGNPNLAPEKGKNYDVGIKVQQRYFNFSLGYFHNQIRDLLTYAPAQNYCVAPQVGLPGSPAAVAFGCAPGQAVVSINARINTSAVEIKGIESTAEGSVPLGRFGSLNPFYSLGSLKGTTKQILPNIITQVTPIFSNLYNNANTPIKLTGSVSDYPLANITPFRIIFGVQYLDSKGRIFAEYNYRHQKRVTRADPLSFIGASLINYGTFASLNPIDKQSIKGGYIWRTERFKATVTLGIDNLTNKFYFEQFQTAPAPGRSFLFGISAEIFNLLKK